MRNRHAQPVPEHDYEVSCECGAQWRVRLEQDDDAMATCLACGADTFNLTDIGEVHSAGRDVEWDTTRE
jgi:predicted nucleic acid-binding Zn ribbon protein